VRSRTVTSNSSRTLLTARSACCCLAMTQTDKQGRQTEDDEQGNMPDIEKTMNRAEAYSNT